MRPQLQASAHRRFRVKINGAVGPRIWAALQFLGSCLPFAAAATVLLTVAPSRAQQEDDASNATEQDEPGQSSCAALPDHATLTQRLREIVTPGESQTNGGLGNHMWAVLVDRQGAVCAVARSGDTFDAQWPGSRGIAASKAFTANGFSLANYALSTANLYWPAQPGSSLYGMSEGNPVDAAALYEGNAANWGTPDDPLVGRSAGGTIAFGGGLALYTPQGELLGALGLSGDESCTDHVIAWKLRHRFNLDNVPKGAASDSTDNIIYDVTVDPASGRQTSTSGYGHPTCSPAAQRIAENFSRTAPIGPSE